jgi:uncharacterized SAM-binding protein YcdF (DUF218 family)
MRRSWSRGSKFGIIAVVIFVALLTLHRPILDGAGAYLKLSCPSPQPSDVIIVLGGEEKGERTLKGVELYKQGIAPKVMLSDGTTMSWRTTAMREMYDLAVLRGVPEADLIQEDRSRSTYENALYTRTLMRQLDYDSAVVVTTDWHAKRSAYIFKKVYASTGIELHYCGTPSEKSAFTDWWQDGEKTQVVLTEWAKTWVYWVRYGA